MAETQPVSLEAQNSLVVDLVMVPKTKVELWQKSRKEIGTSLTDRSLIIYEPLVKHVLYIE